MVKGGYVYILASGRNGTLYIGVTSDLAKRIEEHKSHVVEGFTKKYYVDKLVWCEAHDTIEDAIMREKQLKRWNRAWKLALIEEDNSTWNDLTEQLIN